MILYDRPIEYGPLETLREYLAELKSCRGTEAAKEKPDLEPKIRRTERLIAKREKAGETW